VAEEAVFNKVLKNSKNPPVKIMLKTIGAYTESTGTGLLVI
jgi:hypothetical protein